MIPSTFANPLSFIWAHSQKLNLKTRTEAESGMKTIKFCSETKNGTK